MSNNRGCAAFQNISTYNCSAGELYLWHSRSGALQRLLPPWQKTIILSQHGGIEPGDYVLLKMRMGPFPFCFHGRHLENVPGKMFRDTQEKGPFSSWTHSHYFADNKDGSTLTDHIDYSLPCHQFLPPFINRQINKHILKTLQRLFIHRQNVLRADISLHKKCSRQPLKILVSGAGGLLGRHLLPLLTTGGHRVWTLVRRQPSPEKNEIFWDPANNILNRDDLPALDGVIHLAGEYIGLGRWGKEKKRRVLESRVKGTNLLSSTLATLSQPPGVFLCASAIGYYGNCPGRIVDESQPPGTGYISEVCKQWEQSAKPAQRAGIRTIFMRLGVGLTPQGGGLKKILSSSPFGLIRCFGSGRQFISWMSCDDMVSAMLHAITCTSLHGALNICAPTPVTNRNFMATLAHFSKRPLLFPVPAIILRAVYGQMASEILLADCAVSTQKLQKSGFTFRHPTLESALNNLLGIYSMLPGKNEENPAPVNTEEQRR